MGPARVIEWVRELRNRADAERDERFDAIAAKADRTAFAIIEPALLAVLIATIALAPNTVDRDALLTLVAVITGVVIVARVVARKLMEHRTGLRTGSNDMPWTTLQRMLLTAIVMPSTLLLLWTVQWLSGSGERVGSAYLIGMVIGNIATVSFAWHRAREAR